jgi:hypothetical protein
MLVAMPMIDAPILGRMLRPLAGGLRDELLQAVAALECDPAEQARYDELAERNAEGVIAPEERRELEAIVSANTLLSILRAEARAALQKRAA